MPGKIHEIPVVLSFVASRGEGEAREMAAIRWPTTVHSRKTPRSLNRQTDGRNKSALKTDTKRETENERAVPRLLSLYLRVSFLNAPALLFIRKRNCITMRNHLDGH